MKSIFGAKSKTTDAIAGSKGVAGGRYTGGAVDDIIDSLVASAYDNEEVVRHSVAQGLKEIGYTKQDLVCSVIEGYIKTNKKIQQPHRVALLKILSELLEGVTESIAEDLGLELIEFSVSELTASKDVIADWQGCAAQILVSLFSRYPRQVVQELLKRFEPGMVPHFYVMKTLGDCASVNAGNFVQYMKDVLSRCLPVFGMLKMEPQRWVFASALSKFSDAVTNYNADDSHEKLDFSAELLPAYEVMFNQWLAGRESKVRLATAEAVGQISACLSEEAFTEQLPKLIPAVMTLYKKEEDKLLITKGLSIILEIAARVCPSVLESHVPAILLALHQIVCQPIDATNPSNIKNHNETLRCFEIIGRGYTEQTASFVLERVESRDVSIRVGTLTVMKHLVTRLDTELKAKKDILIAGMSRLLSNKEGRIRKAFSMVIIAMASQQYLTHEGGQNFIAYVIEMSALHDDESSKQKAARGADVVSAMELRQMGDHILECLTTIPEMEGVLWPYLFETICPPSNLDALSAICKSITALAGRKKEANDPSYRIDFDEHVNIPKPTQIAARLLVMLNQPHRRPHMGLRVMEALVSIGGLLHPNLAKKWGSSMGKMVKFLEENFEGPEWQQKDWEGMVLEFFEKMIVQVSDEAWLTELGSALSVHLDTYQDESILKNAVFRYLGTISAKSERKDFIRQKLDAIFHATNHSIELERHGCAHGFGITGAVHLDIVFEKISDAMKNEMVAKSGGFFGLKKDKSASDVDNVKCTIISCFGYVTTHAPHSLITSRWDASVMKNIHPIMTDPKASPQVKETLIDAINQMAKALHRGKLGVTFSVKQRDELLATVVSYIQLVKGADTFGFRSDGLVACANLLRLEPVAPQEAVAKLLANTTNFFDSPTKDDMKDEVDDLLLKYNDLMHTILVQDPTPSTLMKLLQELEPWLKSGKVNHRDRASSTLVFLFKSFIELRDANPCTIAPEIFTQLAVQLALIIPRCTDPHLYIRQTAAEAVELILFIDRLWKLPDLKTETFRQKGARFFQQMADMRQRIENPTFNEQMAVMGDMANTIGELMNKEQYPELLIKCVEGLVDVEQNSASGVCVVLNSLFQTRGADLSNYVVTLVHSIVDNMERISKDSIMNGTLRAIRILASHHFEGVVNELLSRPLPFEMQVVRSFQTLVVDEGLLYKLVGHLVGVMNDSHFEERSGPDSAKKGGNKRDSSKAITAPGGRVPAKAPMAATCALGHIFELPELEGFTIKQYSQLMGTLMLRVGSSAGFNEATQQISETFKNMITCSKDDVLMTAMTEENLWDLCYDEYRFPDAISEMANSVGISHLSELPAVLDFLLPYLKRSCAGQRIVVVTCIAGFIRHAKDNADITTKLVDVLLAHVGDEEAAIRIQALRGLGNLHIDDSMLSRYSASILSAMVTGMEDKEFDVSQESSENLIKILQGVQTVSKVVPMVVNIAVRARNGFDKEDCSARATSLRLFGCLAVFATKTDAEENFIEQLHSNLVPLLLRVNDENYEVRVAAKTTLRTVGHLFHDEAMKTLFDSKSFDETRKLDYEEFIHDVSTAIVNGFASRLNNYLNLCVDFTKSSQQPIPANAVYLAGCILSKLKPEHQSRISASQLCESLTLLLKDANPNVRNRTVKALSLLKDL